MNKKLAPLKAKNDVTHAIQLKLHERLNKKQIWSGCNVIVGRNKKRNDEIKKNQEKANKRPSYRCAAINNRLTSGDFRVVGFGSSQQGLRYVSIRVVSSEGGGQDSWLYLIISL